MLNTKMFDKLVEIDNQIFNNPELGYKEFNTVSIIKSFLNEYCSEITIKELSQTGLRVEIGTGKSIGVVAELDAVYAPNHFASVEKAAHNCGHHSQVVLALGMIKYFYDNSSILNNKLVFIFTPAEEYLDLDYRRKLLDQGKIKSFSGKVNMMLNNEVDDIDCFMHFHAMVEESYDYDINATLAGFDFIEIELLGKTSHAGAEPEKGINALDSAVRIYNYIRDYEKSSEDQIRVNPIIYNDGLLNVVVDKALIRTYVRSFDYQEIKDFIKCIQRELEQEECYGIKYKFTKELGYSEFVQDKSLNKIVTDVLESHRCRYNEFVYASGDIGDFSFLAPTIQIGYGGFTGHIHGDNFKNSDNEFIYNTTLTNFIKIVEEIDRGILDMNLYKKSVEEYKIYKEI